MAPILCAIPIKPFAAGKGRLADGLAQPHRAELSRNAASRVIEACHGAGAAVAVVTGDPAVARWAQDLGVETISETIGAGLDGAAAAVVSAAQSRGVGYAIVHADLPLITPSDIAAAIGALRPGGVVLAPSRDGGTNLLAATDPIRFSYGPGSFRRHLAAAASRAPVIVVRRGLCLDIDEPADIIGAARLPAGSWLAPVVEQLAARRSISSL